jgi:hypothetical protein
MAIHLIPDAAVARYAAGPSDSTVSAVKSLHETVRSVLGTGYETFLQGSYRNNTGVADLNDVDIVAIRRNTTSSVFTNTNPTNPIRWDAIFQEAQSLLEASYHYQGKIERGDKCITINTNFHADVVPAVKIGSIETDPIAIYSFREQRERENFPRDHFQNNVTKQTATGNTYKPTVRMMKRWVRNWFAGTKTAPSFYVECLVHGVPNENFNSDLAVAFFMVAHHISQHVSSTTYIGSVAGDKDILVPQEWDWNRFSIFQSQLTRSVLDVADALQATNATEARRLWRKAFNE